MNQNDTERFQELLTQVCSFYGKDTSEFLFSTYWQSFKMFDYDDVNRAFSLFLQNPDEKGFMPKPSELIKYITGNSESKAMRAWHKVEHAIKSIGAYETVVFDDPKIHEIIENIGGWIQLCQTQEDELKFMRIRFEKAYQAKAMNKSINYSSKLIGISEANNRQAGVKVADPILIGDEKKALFVYNSNKEKKTGFKTLCDVTKFLENKEIKYGTE